MPTYLLTWNPTRFLWDDFGDRVDEVKRFGSIDFDWSCGRNKRLRPGDRVFLLRQGPESRGIIGAGTALDEPYPDERWRDTRTTAGPETMYVPVRWDTLVDEPLIKRSELDKAPFSGVNWNTQISGISIEPRVASALEAAVIDLTGLPDVTTPDETDAKDYPEGATQQITVNAYERNEQARRDCIEHYGTICLVCETDMARLYGPVAKGVIHVHHIMPLSQVSKGYKVNGVRDLRPVCPNCHTILHRRKPPFSIDETKAMWDEAHSKTRPKR